MGPTKLFVGALALCAAVALYPIFSAQFMSRARGHQSSGSSDATAGAMASSTEFGHAVAEEGEEEAQFCNPFSSHSTKQYHFDVLLTPPPPGMSLLEHCADKCDMMALELVRDKDFPRLNIHMGQSWGIQLLEDTFGWKLMTANATMEASPGATSSIDLSKVQSIKHSTGGSGLPDLLTIETGDNETFTLQGGLYLSNSLMKNGIKDELATGKIRKAAGIRENGTGVDMHFRTFVKGGAAAGLIPFALLIGQGILEYIPHVIVGVVYMPVGLGVGAVLGGSLSLTSWSWRKLLSKEKRDFRLSAGKKIFDKLKCLKERFQQCGDDLLVPAGVECK